MKYSCKSCDYETPKKGNFERHKKSALHMRNTKIEYICKCGKMYDSRSGLFKHEKKCAESNKNKIKDLSDQIKLLTEYIKNTEEPHIVNNNNDTINNYNISVKIYINKKYDNVSLLGDMDDCHKPHDC
jgi:hypothetical protein